MILKGMMMDKTFQKLPENISGIIFDIDGTLVDSLDAWADSDRIFLEENNIPYSRDISEKLKTMHYISAAEYLANGFGLSVSVEDVCRRIDEIIGEKYRHEIKAKDGVQEFIQSCSDRGISMCAATSNLRELAEAVLESCGLLGYMKFILTSDEVGSGKDDPEIFLRCAERLGTSPQDTAVFEDSCHAAASAASAGFFTVGVFDRHYADEYEQLKQICSASAENMRELL